MPGAAGHQAPPRARQGTHFVRDAASLRVVGPGPAAALVPPATGARTPRLRGKPTSAGARELSPRAVGLAGAVGMRGPGAPGRRRAGKWPAQGPGGRGVGSSLMLPALRDGAGGFCRAGGPERRGVSLRPREGERPRGAARLVQELTHHGPPKFNLSEPRFPLPCC